MNFDLKWSASEKKVARAAFDKALEVALGKTLAEFKKKASDAATFSDMWEIEDYLQQQRRKIDQLFDYRYSQLIVVFGTLIQEGYLDESQLSGLSDDKREEIRHFLAWHARA
ncbi:MAG: hypothetical protein EOR68_09565 [Mesorhizobium sp.]|uniref:hypothetical protein n=1 Tax=Mesorhizobium sp. TaxID=1871066 RepID=UPI000FE68C12|nr:hypothetical protein [Mesorhizobium sp.]RWM01823.1 MAG: hypothetical protein EOR68_09565 [Mesorhizobium sp.]TIP05258.1 MAG: hypothetical protein E5X72_07780 [Mesorhizobium sp.]TIP38085.1 MAG: hypothetical protein E5X77_33190 [Mesorhizobium sp.]TJV70566.1 MAG: hypothetical protein E5X76_19360 [Mesorhizobium sp.]